MQTAEHVVMLTEDPKAEAQAKQKAGTRTDQMVRQDRQQLDKA